MSASKQRDFVSRKFPEQSDLAPFGRPLEHHHQIDLSGVIYPSGKGISRTRLRNLKSQHLELVRGARDLRQLDPVDFGFTRKGEHSDREQGKIKILREREKRYRYVLASLMDGELTHAGYPLINSDSADARAWFYEMAFRKLADKYVDYCGVRSYSLTPHKWFFWEKIWVCVYVEVVQDKQKQTGKKHKIDKILHDLLTFKKKQSLTILPDDEGALASMRKKFLIPYKQVKNHIKDVSWKTRFLKDPARGCLDLQSLNPRKNWLLEVLHAAENFTAGDCIEEHLAECAR